MKNKRTTCSACQRPYPPEFREIREHQRRENLKRSFAERRAAGLPNGRPLGTKNKAKV